jgi:hypothetical protein
MAPRFGGASTFLDIPTGATALGRGLVDRDRSQAAVPAL